MVYMYRIFRPQQRSIRKNWSGLFLGRIM
jgi:hypothetical protein